MSGGLGKAALLYAMNKFLLITKANLPTKYGNEFFFSFARELTVRPTNSAARPKPKELKVWISQYGHNMDWPNVLE